MIKNLIRTIALFLFPLPYKLHNMLKEKQALVFNFSTKFIDQTVVDKLIKIDYSIEYFTKLNQNKVFT